VLGGIGIALGSRLDQPVRGLLRGACTREMGRSDRVSEASAFYGFRTWTAMLLAMVQSISASSGPRLIPCDSSFCGWM